MSVTRIAAGLVPPSIADERGKAFGRLMERAVSDPDFTRLLFERIDTVDERLLKFLVREFSVEEFIEPGMSAPVIRELVKASYDLHATKGFIQGVRRGLLMLGMRVVWKQWFQAQPTGQPGTHTATVFVNQTIFEDQNDLLDARMQRAAQRMISGMKRWSQDVTFQLGVMTKSRAGAAGALRGASIVRIAASGSAVKDFSSQAGVAGSAAAALVIRANGHILPPLATHSDVVATGFYRAIQLVSFRMEASPT